MPAEEAIKFNVEAMDLEKLWPLADIITVHTPLIPQTRGKVAGGNMAGWARGVGV